MVQDCKRSCTHKKNDYVYNVEKVTKNYLTIISEPQAHPHTMQKTHAKFQNEWYKASEVPNVYILRVKNDFLQYRKSDKK